MSGTFSRVALEALLAARVDVRGLVVPGLRPRPLTPARRPIHPSAPTAVHVAWDHGVPVREVGSGAEDPPDILGDSRPDALVVACFPWRLRRSWLELAPLGALNLHPSLLPAYRGPTPLFWQLRAGETRTGVTLHRLDEGIDTGEILAQAPLPFPDGLGWDALEERLAALGARLLVGALGSPTTARAQPEAGASYQGPPAAADLELPTTWTARRAFNFIRGAAGFGPFTILTADAPVPAREAVSYRTGGIEPGCVRRVADGTEVGFASGSVVVL